MLTRIVHRTMFAQQMRFLLGSVVGCFLLVVILHFFWVALIGRQLGFQSFATVWTVAIAYSATLSAFPLCVLIAVALTFLSKRRGNELHALYAAGVDHGEFRRAAMAFGLFSSLLLVAADVMFTSRVGVASAAQHLKQDANEVLRSRLQQQGFVAQRGRLLWMMATTAGGNQLTDVAAIHRSADSFQTLLAAPQGRFRFDSPSNSFEIATGDASNGAAERSFSLAADPAELRATWGHYALSEMWSLKTDAAHVLADVAGVSLVGPAAAVDVQTASRFAGCLRQIQTGIQHRLAAFASCLVFALIASARMARWSLMLTAVALYYGCVVVVIDGQWIGHWSAAFLPHLIVIAFSGASGLILHRTSSQRF